jgi:uncharacterized protein YybS (DUF2232 family)
MWREQYWNDVNCCSNYGKWENYGQWLKFIIYSILAVLGVLMAGPGYSIIVTGKLV